MIELFDRGLRTVSGALAVSLWLLFSAVPVIAQPVLRVAEGTTFDLGDVPEGVTSKRTLTLLNEGTDPLEIGEVTTSCGCTSARPAKKILAPGERTLLPVEILSKGFRGPVRREVHIASNDPRSPRTTITYYSVIRTEIESNPGYVNFAVIPMGGTATRAVVLANRTRSPVRLRSFSASDRRIQGDFSSRIIAAGDSVYLTVTFRPAKRGEVKGEMQIKTDNAGTPVVHISYIGVVR